MSTYSSEKNKYDKVPFPSEQRFADSTIGCSSMVALLSVSFSSNAYISVSFRVLCLGRSISELSRKMQKGRSGGFPGGLCGFDVTVTSEPG
jgi:hypothetical protein